LSTRHGFPSQAPHRLLAQGWLDRHSHAQTGRDLLRERTRALEVAGQDAAHRRHQPAERPLAEPGEQRGLALAIGRERHVELAAHRALARRLDRAVPQEVQVRDGRRDHRRLGARVEHHHE
jgi:hypothetical protein